MSVHPSGRLALSVSKDKTLRLVSSSGLLESNSIESLMNVLFHFIFACALTTFLVVHTAITLIVWQLSTLEVFCWKKWQFFSSSFLFSFFLLLFFQLLKGVQYSINNLFLRTL